jgi:hypothetical protein
MDWEAGGIHPYRGERWPSPTSHGTVAMQWAPVDSHVCSSHLVRTGRSAEVVVAVGLFGQVLVAWLREFIEAQSRRPEALRVDEERPRPPHMDIACPPPGMRSQMRQKARMSSDVPKDTRT